MAALGVALTAYALDCGGMTTPEQAMDCCHSMPCSSHGHHGQDCCKTMPAMHAPFVQPSPVAAATASRHMVAVALPATFEIRASWNWSARGAATHCHAPPGLSPPALLPLRI